MAEINWTHEAERWLKGIYDFIALDSPLAAKRVIEGIYNKTQTLRKYPKIGYKYHSDNEDTRILLYGHYRIVYLIKTDKNIDILGVFHGALDIEKYLF